MMPSVPPHRSAATAMNRDDTAPHDSWTRPRRDPFDTYPPPHDVAADMVVVAGTCAAGPVRTTFPGLPLRVAAGRAIVAAWFARIDRIRSGPVPGVVADERSEPGELPYGELTVALLLTKGRVFVPGIYATSDLSVAVGHRYGMPKSKAPIVYAESGSNVQAHVPIGDRESHVEGRALTVGAALPRLVARALPWQAWPASFPSGASVHAAVVRVERARPMWLSRRRLDVDESWLPEGAWLLPLALHVVGLGMVLPGPAPMPPA
jgi:hypothetical protein